MQFQVLSPYYTTIEGDSLKEAIKNFVKINHSNQINNLIIQDQMNKYNAQIRYFQVNNKNKANISINRIINNDSLTVYPNNTFNPILKETNGVNVPIGIMHPSALSSNPNNIINLLVKTLANLSSYNARNATTQQTNSATTTPTHPANFATTTPNNGTTQSNAATTAINNAINNYMSNQNQEQNKINLVPIISSPGMISAPGPINNGLNFAVPYNIIARL